MFQREQPVQRPGGRNSKDAIVVKSEGAKREQENHEKPGGSVPTG